MSKQTEALKLAREMLIENREYIQMYERPSYLALYDKAIARVEEALAEQPAQQPLTDEQILAGAQALCQQMAEACNVNPGDQWNLYADTFKEDAKAVLTAAAKLREKNA